MALLVHFGVYLGELTLMLELGAVGCAVLEPFGPHLCLRLPLAGGKTSRSGLIQSGQGDGHGCPALQAGRDGPTGFAPAQACPCRSPVGGLQHPWHLGVSALS